MVELEGLKPMSMQSRAKLCSLFKVQQKSAKWRFLFKLDQSVHSCHGGAEGIRTPDLLLAKQALYQLSYSPTKEL